MQAVNERATARDGTEKKPQKKLKNFWKTSWQTQESVVYYSGTSAPRKKEVEKNLKKFSKTPWQTQEDVV